MEGDISQGKFADSPRRSKSRSSTTSEEEHANRQEFLHSTISQVNITNYQVMSPTEIPPKPMEHDHETSEIVETEWTKLGPNCRYNHNRCVADHQYLFYGEEMNDITGVKPVVIKLLNIKERNLRHAKICKKLSHPHIVTALHVGSCMLGNLKRIYIALELCEEMNLYEYVNSNKNDKKSFNSRVSLAQSRQLMDALGYIHSNNIIHRDLKPHNVLISREKKSLKITDFGMGIETCDAANDTETSIATIGTPGYRAPEVCNNDECTESADVFSLALIFYFLWSYGLHPYGDDPDEWNINIKRRKDPSFQGLVIEDTENAVQLLQEMLHHSPEHRPTADQLNCFEIFATKSQCATRKKQNSQEGSRSSKSPQQTMENARKGQDDFGKLASKKTTMVECKLRDDTAQPIEKPKNFAQKLGTELPNNSRLSSVSDPENSPRVGHDRSAPNHSSTREREKTRQKSLHRPRSATDVTLGPFEQKTSLAKLPSPSERGLMNRIVVIDKLLCGTRVFNPAMNTWKPMHMIQPKLSAQNFTAVTLSGYIYLLFNDKKVLRLKISKFNAMWEDLPSMKYYHGEYPPALAARGKIYAVGSAGGDCKDPIRLIECFDQANNFWSGTDEPMTIARYHHAVTFNKDCIYCIGGVLETSVLDSVEAYDCYRKSWHSLPPMKYHRANPSAAYHAGKLYVLGGYISASCSGDTRLASVEAYDSKTTTWTVFTPMLKHRAQFTVLVINGGDLYAIGGDEKRKSNDALPKNTIERYSFPIKKWAMIPMKKDVRIDSMSATAAYLLD